MVNSLGLGKLLGGSSGGNKLMVRHVFAFLPQSCFLSIPHHVRGSVRRTQPRSQAAALVHAFMLQPLL